MEILILFETMPKRIVQDCQLEGKREAVTCL